MTYRRGEIQFELNHHTYQSSDFKIWSEFHKPWAILYIKKMLGTTDINIQNIKKLDILQILTFIGVGCFIASADQKINTKAKNMIDNFVHLSKKIRAHYFRWKIDKVRSKSVRSKSKIRWDPLLARRRSSLINACD